MTNNNTQPIELESSVEIYVPTQCRCGKPLPEDIRAEVFEEVKNKMADRFGGGSVLKSDLPVERIEGFWSRDKFSAFAGYLVIYFTEQVPVWNLRKRVEATYSQEMPHPFSH